MKFLLLPLCLLLDTGTESLLRRNAGFDDRDLAEARAGRRVVRTLDPGIPRELVTVGVTRFEIPFDYYVARARTGDLYRTGPTLIQIGRFSPAPSPADLRGLTLEPGELEPFAAFDSAAARSEAAAKAFLVRLVRAAEVRPLLTAAPYVAHYGYPPPKAGGVTEYFAWAKVNIGLRTLVRLTKVTVWERNEESRRDAVIVTEQIFASRYFQASLQIDHVFADGSGPVPATFLVTINGGSCALLDTAIARLFRPLIINRTCASTRRTLDLAKLTLETEYRAR